MYRQFSFSVFFVIFALKSRLSVYYPPSTVIKMFGLGTQEILIIALIVLLLFGGKKIPELMKGLGKGVKSFKEGMNSLDDDDQSEGKNSSSDTGSEMRK